MRSARWAIRACGSFTSLSGQKQGWQFTARLQYPQAETKLTVYRRFLRKLLAVQILLSRRIIRAPRAASCKKNRTNLNTRFRDLIENSRNYLIRFWNSDWSRAVNRQPCFRPDKLVKLSPQKYGKAPKNAKKKQFAIFSSELISR